MSPQWDAEKESESLRQQAKRVLTLWAARCKDQLESADWHTHWDSNEDVLVVITKHEAAFRISVQSMELSVIEKRRRAWEKTKKA
jgi:hypothetical protein